MDLIGDRRSFGCWDINRVLCKMAYEVFPDICDRRKDLLIDECDANILDMILCG